MTEESTGGKFSFLDIVLRIAGLVQSGRKRRAAAVKLLADKKFAQLEATHDLFVRLLTELEEAARNASDKLTQTDDIDIVRNVFADAVTKIEVLRTNGRESRMSNFSEAITFARFKLQDKGIFNTLDKGAARRLQALMKSYAKYFLVDNNYMHELGHALENVRSSSVLFSIRRKTFDFDKLDLEHAASETAEVARIAIEASRRKWKDVTIEYHKLNYYLLEQNLV